MLIAYVTTLLSITYVFATQPIIGHQNIDLKCDVIHGETISNFTSRF